MQFFDFFKEYDEMKWTKVRIKRNLPASAFVGLASCVAAVACAAAELVAEPVNQ